MRLPSRPPFIYAAEFAVFGITFALGRTGEWNAACQVAREFRSELVLSEDLSGSAEHNSSTCVQARRGPSLWASSLLRHREQRARDQGTATWSGVSNVWLQCRPVNFTDYVQRKKLIQPHLKLLQGADIFLTPPQQASYYTLQVKQPGLKPRGP